MDSPCLQQVLCDPSYGCNLLDGGLLCYSKLSKQFSGICHHECRGDLMVTTILVFAMFTLTLGWLTPVKCIEDGESGKTVDLNVARVLSVCSTFLMER